MYKNCSECQKQFLYTTCSPRFKLGIFMYLTCNSMNNLSLNYGLVDAKTRASDKDLPVPMNFCFYQSILKNFNALQFTDLLKNVIFANNQEACIATEGLLKEFYPLRVFPAAFSSYSLGVGVCVYTLPWLAGAESSSNNNNTHGTRPPPPRPRAARAAAAGSYI